MTFDKTESLIREAVTEQAGRAVDGSTVLRALRRERPRRSMTFVFAAVAVVVAAVSAVVIPQLVRREQAPPAAPGVSQERTILVMGRDGSGYLDTVMVTRVAGDRATALSVPRDTLVDIPGTGQGKVSTAFARVRNAAVAGGASPAGADDTAARAMVATIGTLTGTRVDDYLLIDMAAIDKAATAVGGVEVCLRVATRDRFSGADFPAGRQTLSGPAAVAFVRQRHGLPNGDLDRIKRQQVFLAGLIGRVTPGNAADVLTAVRDHVVTDADLLGLAGSLAGVRGGIRVAVIPVGEPVRSAHGDGFDVSPETVRPFVESAMAGEAPLAPDCVD